MRDLTNRGLLIARQRERELSDERVEERPVDPMTNTGLFGRERALPRNQADLHAEELVEDQSPTRCAKLFHRVRAVNRTQRGGAIEKIITIEDLIVEGIREA